MIFKYKALIPVVVLAGLSILTIVAAINNRVEVDGTSYGFILTPGHYAAFVAVLLNLVAFFAFRSFYKYVLMVTLLTGLADIINFTPWNLTVSFSINSLTIGFQPQAFLVIVFTLLINFKEISNKFIISPDHPSEQMTTNIAKRYEEDVVKFRNVYTNYSKEELTKIIADKVYTPAALEAAQQILNEMERSVNV